MFLSPSFSIASGLGPMKSILQLRQTSLKWRSQRESQNLVNRFGTTDLRGADDLIDAQIAVALRAGPIQNA